MSDPATMTHKRDLKFGDALDAIQYGGRIRRPCWDESVFVFMQVPATISAATVPNMQSLPPLVKQEFIRRGAPLKYRDQFARVSADNNITSWAPTVSDVLAQDWEILD